MRSDKLPELPTPWNLQNLLSSAKEIYDSLQHSNWKYPYLSFFLLEMYFYKIHLSINCNFRTIIWNVSIYFRNPPPRLNFKWSHSLCGNPEEFILRVQWALEDYISLEEIWMFHFAALCTIFSSNTYRYVKPSTCFWRTVILFKWASKALSCQVIILTGWSPSGNLLLRVCHIIL